MIADSHSQDVVLTSVANFLLTFLDDNESLACKNESVKHETLIKDDSNSFLNLTL